MRIISTNLAEERTIERNGKEVKTGIYKNPVDEPIKLGHFSIQKDVVSDKTVHGGIDKACYAYSSNHYPFWKNEYPELQWQWGMFGENLTIEGLNEADVHIGDIYNIGKALVQVSQPRQPCFKLGYRFGDNMIIKKFINSDYPGVYFRVLQEGEVKTGDTVTLDIRNSRSLTILQVYKLLYGLLEDQQLLSQALEDPNLAMSCKRDLGKRSK